MATAEHRPGKNYRIGPTRGLGSLRRELVRAVQFLAAHVGIKVESDDITSATATLDGIRARFVGGAGGSSDSTRPLYVSESGRVVPGTILGAMPTIGGTALDAGTPPTLTIPSSGTRYAIATVTGTASVNTLDGRAFFTPSMTGIAVAISLTTTSPTPADLVQTVANGATATFKIHIATFVDGRKTAQNGFGPITNGAVHDDLSGAGTGTLHYNQPS